MQDLETARWDDVKVFLAAYRHPSLGTAAARLGVDTSTVSRRLTAFEAFLGARLFERTREGLLRTLAAERVLGAAEAMEAAHGRLSREASDLEAAAEGVVRLATDPGIAEEFVAPALARLRAKHPNLDIELDVSPEPRDLSRREADLALRSMRPHGADLVATKLASTPWRALGSPALVRSLGTLTSWSTPAWIAWDRDNASLPAARWLARHASDARIALRTSHFAAQLAAAEGGLGLALVPEAFARVRSLAPARVAKSLAASVEALPVGELWLVGHRVLRDVPRVAAVWSFFDAELRRALRPPARA